MSRYKALKHRSDNNTDPAFNYRGRILLRYTQSSIWGNPFMKSFGVKLEKIINHLIYQVKTIKKTVNYIVDQDDDIIN